MIRIGGSQKVIVGYDLGWNYVQISYCNVEKEQVETISSVAGEEAYVIPMVLCKRYGMNQWFYGKEALQQAREEQGILVENLLNLALEGEPVQIEEQEYDPVALLTLFFKRSLGMLAGVTGTDRIEALMITCERMDDLMIGILDRMSANLRLKTDRITYQSYQESYYYYMLRQSQELWKEPSVLFYYHENRMSFFHMECNKRTTPLVVLISREEEEFPSRASMAGGEEAGNILLDQSFLKFAQEKMGEERIASVFLIGEDFSEDWLKGSLKFLCDRRRIFLGNNMFSKGACYGMLEHFRPSEAGEKTVYLGEDKLKSNIGMEIMRRGDAAYLALLDAGTSWKNAKSSLEFYLKEENTLELTITSLNGGGKRKVPIVLEQLAGDMARIRMDLEMKAENILNVEISDLGFGEFRPADHQNWVKEIKI